MSVENGLTKLRTVRHHIAVLQRRREFLEQRIDALTSKSTSYDRAELASLEWAIPILEAEWDNVARLRREFVDDLR